MSPGTYSVRARVTGLSGTQNSSQVTNGLTITKEDTLTEYLGDTSATEGTLVAVSADVDDFDGGVGSGNDEFGPDANLASTVPATNGIRYQLWSSASCVGTSVAGPTHDDVDSSGSAAGASLSLASVSAGTYYLKTTYLGNAFYSTSSDCDTITVNSVDATGPTISITTDEAVDAGTSGAGACRRLPRPEESLRRLRAQVGQRLTPNVKTVCDRYSWPGFSIVDGNFGWFGESG